jgi:hypothetical protein
MQRVKAGGFLPEPFDGSSGINALGCIHADQPHALARFEHDRVAVDRTLDASELLSDRKPDEH